MSDTRINPAPSMGAGPTRGALTALGFRIVPVAAAVPAVCGPAWGAAGTGALGWLHRVAAAHPDLAERATAYAGWHLFDRVLATSMFRASLQSVDWSATLDNRPPHGVRSAIAARPWPRRPTVRVASHPAPDPARWSAQPRPHYRTRIPPARLGVDDHPLISGARLTRQRAGRDIVVDVAVAELPARAVNRVGAVSP
jgi:hypothetical protein